MPCDLAKFLLANVNTLVMCHAGFLFIGTLLWFCWLVSVLCLKVWWSLTSSGLVLGWYQNLRINNPILIYQSQWNNTALHVSSLKFAQVLKCRMISLPAWVPSLAAEKQLDCPAPWLHQRTRWNHFLCSYYNLLLRTPTTELANIFGKRRRPPWTAESFLARK